MLGIYFPHQFSSVAQLYPTLCYPMDGSTPGFPVHHQLLELAQTHVHQVGDAIQFDGHEFEQALGVGDGQGSLACCSAWCCKDLDTTEGLNSTEVMTGKNMPGVIYRAMYLNSNSP